MELIGRLWPFLRPYRPTAALAVLALLLSSGGTLALGQGLRWLVDSGFATGSEQALLQSIFALGAAGAVMAVATFVRHYCVSWIGERISADVRTATFRRLIETDPAYFELNSPGEIQSRLTADTTLIQTVMGSSASIALRNLLLFAGGLTLLFITEWRLTLIVLAGVPLVVAPILIFGRQVRRLSRRSQDQLARAGAFVAESLGAIKTVHAFNHQAYDRRRFEELADDAFRAALQTIRFRSFLILGAMILVFLSVGVMLYVGGRDVMANRISGGQLLAFAFYAAMVASSVGAMSEVIGDLQRAAGAFERLDELMHVEAVVRAPTNPHRFKERPAGAIEIQNLRFAYPARPELHALDDFSLSVAAGETVALVGPSGAGKSTVFELLLRFHDPREGRILIDGIDLRELDPVDYRRWIAITPQEPRLFSGSILANIAYGRPDAGRDEIEQAATLANAAGFIAALPEGYAAELGEGGVRLSGGQRQRIAIARALLKDPAILLLDEATSALDAESERAVQEALSRLKSGRTTIIIAHRLSTVLNADRIAVMESGSVVAVGVHAELYESSPLYRRFAELQLVDARGGSIGRSGLVA